MVFESAQRLGLSTSTRSFRVQRNLKKTGLPETLLVDPPYGVVERIKETERTFII